MNPASLDQLVAPPFMVVGAARSGTTWVFDILTAHPEVAGVFESWLFTPNNGVGSMYTKAHWPPRRSGLGNLLERKNLTGYVNSLAEQVFSHALEPHHRFLVEKSPSHIFSMPLINEIFPGAKFVHVIRDGRDVVDSVLAAANSWVPDWKESFGRSVRSSAHAWKHSILKARHDSVQLESRYLEIRYEDLHKDPSSQYIKLLDFCGLNYDDNLLKEIYDATDFSSNYKPKPAGFRRQGKTGNWRNNFSRLDAIKFDLAAGEVLIELDYERDRRWLVRPWT